MSRTAMVRRRSARATTTPLMPSVLAPFAGDEPLDTMLTRALRALILLTKAAGGVLEFSTPHGPPIVASAGPRDLRTALLAEVTQLLGSRESLDVVLATFAAALARLIDFDAVDVLLVDTERAEFEVLDVTARTVHGAPLRDVRLPLDGTLLERVVATGMPMRVDDLAAAGVPPA